VYENKYEYINTLVSKSKDGDEKALFELFEFYMPLIISSVNRCIAKDTRLSNYREDIISDSIFVFSKLVDKYDSSLTYFSYYISTRIDINLFRFINVRYFSEQEVELSDQ
jgi:DNA-directed RNA polymerase specialized sigma subunit